MEGNASVCQVYPVSRITGEVRAEFSRGWGHGFEQEGAGGGGATQSVRGSYKILKGINVTVLEGMHQFIMYILPVVQPVRIGRSVQAGGLGGGGVGAERFLTALGRIYMCRGLLYVWC